MITASSLISIGTDYLQAWGRHDLKAVGSHLHPDLHFKGPLGERHGREAFLAGVARLLPLWQLQRVNLRSSFESGNQAMFAYDFVCAEPLGVCPIAELLTFQDGKIIGIELFLDARPFEKLTQGPPPGK